MVEALYYQCYYAYLLGDFYKAGMFFNILVAEFASTGKMLNKDQLRTLVTVRSSLESGRIEEKKWLDSSPALPIPGQAACTKQSELVHSIHSQCLSQLKEALEDDSIALYNVEHPCPPYGAVDMVYRGNGTVYPIEIKKDCGDHDIIGQIGKYDLHHKLNLHLKHYDFVQSVTICRTYQPYALQELKAMGVVTLIYTGSVKTLSLKRVWCNMVIQLAVYKDPALLEREVKRLIETGKNASYVVDLRDVTFLVSSSIAQIVKLFKHSSKKGIEFEVINADKDIYDMLETLKLTKVMKVSK
jgi:anti-anti-sigma factor